MEDKPQFLWDPVDEPITIQTFSSNQTQLLNHLQFYRSKPYLIKLFLAGCSLITFIALILFFIVPYDPRLLAITFLPPILYYGYIRHLQEEIILYLICEKNNWPYNPNTDFDRIKKFISFIPEIFKEYIEENDQNLQEQIWGTIQNKNDFTSFWSAQFEYTTGSGKNQTTHTEYVYFIRLPKSLTIRFSLVKTGLLTFIERGLRTESAEFNKKFEIQAQATDPASKNQIMACLSPSVLTRMIDFSNNYHPKRIDFIGDVMAIVLPNKLWKTKYTNFLKSISIDPRDETQFYEALTAMVELPAEMLQFIK